MIEGPVLVLGVASQGLDELVDGRLVERVQIGAHTEVGQEAAEPIVVPSRGFDAVVVEGLGERKELSLFELEMSEETSLEIGKGLS
jgi:hypothetical protein